MLKDLKFFFILFLILLVPVQVTKAEELLSWEDCLREAKENNPELISSTEAVKIQEANKGITKSALFPQISANLEASTAKTSTTSSSGVTTSATNDSYSYGVSGSQLIFDGLKTFHDIKAASENVLAAGQAYRFTSSEVRLSLRSAFINLLKAQELVSVADEIVKIRRDNLILVTLQYESGLEHKGSLLTAEADLAEANLELSQAKRNVEFSQRQLSKEMGRKELKPIAVKADFLVKETAKDKPNFEELAKENPAVLQALANKNSRLFGIKSSYGNFLPQISGTAGANKKSAVWPPKNDNWDLGLSLTMPIFEGGLKTAQLAQAKAEYNQSVADEFNTRNSVIVTLEQTWAALQDGIETVGVQQKSLEASQERAKISKAQYSNGFISFDNWIIIEDELVRVKKSFLEARANSLLAEANWIQAKGETLEYAQE